MATATTNPHTGQSYGDLVTFKQTLAMRKAGDQWRINFAELSESLYGVRYDELNRKSGSELIVAIILLGALKSNPGQWFSARALIPPKSSLPQVCVCLSRLIRARLARTRGSGHQREYAAILPDLEKHACPKCAEQTLLVGFRLDGAVSEIAPECSCVFSLEEFDALAAKLARQL